MRELTADLDGLRQLLEEKIRANKELMDERDKRYSERDRDRQIEVDKALHSMKEQTKASFDASEKAIAKAEDAQKTYNQTHNDLSRKLDDQTKMQMPRVETETRFSAVEEKLSDLRDRLTAGSSAVQGAKSLKDDLRSNVGLIVMVAGVLGALIAKWFGK